MPSDSSRRTFLKASGAASVAALSGLAGCGGQSQNQTTAGGDGGDGGDGGGGDGGATTTTTTQSQMADEIVFYNAGSLKYDPGTEANIERFEEETGITVNVNEVPWSNLKTSLTTIWRNKGSKVDAFNGPTWWLADFVNSEWIAPLNLSDDHMGKFPSSLQSLVTFDGQAYMAPEFGKWGTFLYDKNYFSENGFDSPPGTWDEVVSMGSELAGSERDGFAFSWANKDVFMFKQFLYQAGGQLFNDNYEPVFYDTGMEVFDWIGRLQDNNVLPDGMSSMGEGGVGDTFIAGGLAMTEAWTPLGARVLNSDGWSNDRVGFAKPPAGPSSRATFQDTNGISVSAFSERKQAARKFAEFMTTPKSSKNNMLVEGNPSPHPEVYDDPEVQDKYPSKLVDMMKFNLENAKSETYLAQPQVDNFLSNELTAAFVGDKSPDAALKAAQSKITNLYKTSGIL